jgi:hypothetical protein
LARLRDLNRKRGQTILMITTIPKRPPTPTASSRCATAGSSRYALRLRGAQMAVDAQQARHGGGRSSARSLVDV